MKEPQKPSFDFDPGNPQEFIKQFTEAGKGEIDYRQLTGSKNQPKEQDKTPLFLKKLQQNNSPISLEAIKKFLKEKGASIGGITVLIAMAIFFIIECPKAFDKDFQFQDERLKAYFKENNIDPAEIMNRGTDQEIIDYQQEDINQ